MDIGQRLDRPHRMACQQAQHQPIRGHQALSVAEPESPPEIIDKRRRQYTLDSIGELRNSAASHSSLRCHGGCGDPMIGDLGWDFSVPNKINKILKILPTKGAWRSTALTSGDKSATTSSTSSSHTSPTGSSDTATPKRRLWGSSPRQTHRPGYGWTTWAATETKRGSGTARTRTCSPAGGARAALGWMRRIGGEHDGTSPLVPPVPGERTAEGRRDAAEQRELRGHRRHGRGRAAHAVAGQGVGGDNPCVARGRRELLVVQSDEKITSPRHPRAVVGPPAEPCGGPVEGSNGRLSESAR